MALGLAALYVILIFGHALVLPAAIVAPLMASAAATAVALLALCLWVKRRPPPPRWAYPLALAIAALVLFNSLLHLYLSGEPQQSTNLMLVIIAVAFFFLDSRWFIAVVAVTLGLWVAIAAAIGPSPQWGHYGFAMLHTLLAAGLIHIIHLRNLRRLEGLRLENEQRLAELLAEVGERRRTEAALRLNEERFRVAIKGSPMTVFNQDRELRVTWVDKPVLGLAVDEVLGKTDADLLPPEDAGILQRIKRQVLDSGVGTRAEVRVHYADMERIYDLTVEPLRDAAGGAVTGITCAAFDITGRRRAEEQARLQQAQLTHMARLSIAGEMATGLAHELNQPLTAIVLYAQTCLDLLKSGTCNTEKLMELMEAAAQQGLRAGAILQRLRNFTRKSLPQKTRTDVNALAREVVHFVDGDFERHAVALRLDLAEPLPAVWADAVQIQQVLWNLLRNAIEAMTEAGAPPQRELTLRTAAFGRRVVEVAVSDSGPGLSPEAARQIFQPFFTTRPEGMGMGLSISKSIVEAHDGLLWATPNAGGGVTFHFTLPVAP
ncbi:MAG: ATP-binding protein [Pseudomonadota bacterium]|nr:ATP-binding protein [Pseudomonadota bacterium]